MPKAGYRIPIEGRFWAKVNKSTLSGCWLWTGSKNNMGYGTLWREGTMIFAHRFSMELENGPIPKGMIACHHCDTPLCVRPEHLFLGTHQENMNDKITKGRQGIKGKRWKLREDLVAQVQKRIMAGIHRDLICAEFTICRRSVQRISVEMKQAVLVGVCEGDSKDE